MRKIFLITLVLAIALLGASTFAFANDRAVFLWPRSLGFLADLPQETRQEVEKIIADYQEKMAALREEMREKIAPYIPEDLSKQYENCYFPGAMFSLGRGACRFWQELPEEKRLEVESIMEEYLEQIAALQEEISAARESGNKELLEELYVELRELKQKWREKIASYLPEEWKESRSFAKHCMPRGSNLKRRFSETSISIP